MAWALISIPLGMAAIAWAVPSDRWRPWLLPPTALAHTILTFIAVSRSPSSGASLLALDPPGRLILLTVSGLFLCCSIYLVGYLKYRRERSSRVFCACLLAFLGGMTLVTWSHNLGLMWVALEATALTTAPLIYFNHSTRSIEATWKYLLIGSIGIAIALLGTFFVAYGAVYAGVDPSLTFDALLRNASQISKPWLRAGFVLLLVGYGTKMGLAPMHTWKPDAYGEAPGVVGALFAGGFTSCAFLALVRVYRICVAAGEGAYTSKLLIFIGLLSMLVAAVFMVGQRDFKRMLAYSSVEHMGILALGLGIGGAGIFGALLHTLNNALTKGVLFLSAGNIHRAYDSKTTDVVRGAIARLPISGALFLAGFLAITGSPPFGPFVSELTIVNAAFGSGRFLSGGLFLFFMFVVFIGMGATVLSVVQGRHPAETPSTTYRDGWLTTLPALVLMSIVLLLGLYIPGPLNRLLDDAARYLGTQP